MAEEYIKKEDAIQSVMNHDLLKSDWSRAWAEYMLEDATTADVAPVRHGRWAETVTDGFLFVSCSACGFKTGRIDYNYCPNCGAKMDEEVDA